MVILMPRKLSGRAAPHSSASQHIVDKIETVAPLSRSEKTAILALPVALKDFRRGVTVVREGDHPTQSFAVLEGVTGMIKFTGAGDRHIVIFHFARDIPDLQSLHLDRLDVSIETITSCTLGFIPHAAIREVCTDFPRIAAMLWRATLVDAAVLRECVLSIARRPALMRVAHFLCEFVVRMKLAGRGDAAGCDLPLTQTELADGLGLSQVHVNRIVQSLRKRGLIALNRDQFIVNDWNELKTVGDFDPGYLHLTPRQRNLLGDGAPLQYRPLK